jgi:5'-phosphate synthase pdxT subunit
MSNFSEIKKTYKPVIGVLGLQGAVSEHIKAVDSCGAIGKKILKPKELTHIDGLIIPGGESTTITKLMDRHGFIPAIQEFAYQGKAIFGTCAGMIVLAHQVTNPEQQSLDLINIQVKRNAFGRQVDSFEVDLPTPFLGKEASFPGVFIRAPLIERCGQGTETLSSLEFNGQLFPVLAKQKKVLVAAFHPELTEDLRLHNWFIYHLAAGNNQELKTFSSISKGVS